MRSVSKAGNLSRRMTAQGPCGGKTNGQGRYAEVNGIKLYYIGEAMKQDFDFSKEITGIKATTLVVAGNADIFPPAHAVELFGLLGGGKRDGGWDRSGRPASRLAILPGLTHYTIFSAPALAATVIPFLDEPPPKGQ